jgi:hypothetical protein
VSDEPSGTCVVCHRRDPLPDLTPCCGPCRRWLRRILWEIPDYCAELEARDAGLTGARDALAMALPAGPVPGQSAGPKVAGSTDPPVPVNVDALDLLAPARPQRAGTSDPSHDQTGYPSVAAVLDSWVRDWHETFCPADDLPGAEVGDLVAWLVRRVEEMCSQHPAIDEFAREIRDLHSTLRRVSGWAPRGSQRPEESCPDCHVAAVWREDIATDHECMHCGRMFTAEEFAEAHGKTVPWAA